MEVEMHSWKSWSRSAPLLLLSLLLTWSLPAKADEVGRGVLCNTKEQVERFIALRDHGKEAHRALQMVNDEAQSATACNYVMVMFTSEKPIEQVTINARLVYILQITVKAFDHGTGWRQVPETVQYTAFVEKGLVS
jgi:hypothetical protein